MTLIQVIPQIDKNKTVKLYKVLGFSHYHKLLIQDE